MRPSLTCSAASKLARVTGTSIEMIKRHYGTICSQGAAAGIATRLAAFEAEQDRAIADA